MAKAKNDTKEATKSTDAPIEQAADQSYSTRPSWSLGSLFWGSIIILVGVLLLLDNLDILNVDFSEVWRLWPLAIVAVGVSLLPLKGWAAVAINVLLIAGVLGAVLFVTSNDADRGFLARERSALVTRSEKVSSDAPNADVSIVTGAGGLELNSSSDSELLTAELKTNSNRLSLKKTSETKDGTQRVRLEADNDDGAWMNMRRNDLYVTLSESIPLSLDVEAGAVSITGDLSKLRVKSLSVDAGASSVDLKLGNKETLQEVSIKAGASSVSLQVPRSVGVRVVTDNGLSSTDFDGIDKLEEGEYESDGYASATHKILIRADMGVSSFTINRYE